MPRTDSLKRLLEDALAEGFRTIGQVAIDPGPEGFTLRHRDDPPGAPAAEFSGPSEAVRLARFDDSGAFRPLKSAPSLRHGWRLTLHSIAELHLALDGFYPAALGNWRAWLRGDLRPVALRTTVNRQTGMYRITGKITDSQAAELIKDVCVAGCRRCRLWAIPEDATPPPANLAEREIPLLCGEACNLLVAAARRKVKGLPLDQAE